MDTSRERSRTTDAAAGTSPEEWAKRLRRGEGDAVRHVRERVGRILAFKRLKIPKQDRDDLEQEIMTEVWQAVNRSGFDFMAGFWGFVEVVASRRCIDWLRSRKDRAPLVEDLRDESKTPLEKTLDDERAKLATEILAALDPDCRKLILWRLKDGLPYSRIASAVGKTEGALRVQMYRCVRVAQRILNERGIDVWREPGGSESHEAP
jgi:RNA polymerase sigma factor (sigma-70 family)